MTRPTKRLSLFGRIAGPFLVPVETCCAAARRRGQGRPSGRRGQRLALDDGEPGRTILAIETIGASWFDRRYAAALAALLGLVLACAPRPAAAAPQTSPALDAEIAAAVDEAATRFGLPRAWILAVIRVESGGRPSAVSPKGAMGLLQLMPATWRELSAKLNIGDDPYAVRANVLAGASYLRRMYDRFGSPGFLAAYNAGPERYAQHLAGGRALPRETQDYVRALAPIIAASPRPPVVDARNAPATSSLFVDRSTGVDGAEGKTFPSIRADGLWP